MATFKYVEEGFVAYLAVDRPEVNSAQAFEALCQDVFRDALARLGIAPCTVPPANFSVGILEHLIENPCENLCGVDDLDAYADAVDAALAAQGVAILNLGYFYYPDEVDETAAQERDRAAEVYRDAVVVRNFRLNGCSQRQACGCSAV